jgi:hypothetical protein
MPQIIPNTAQDRMPISMIGNTNSATNITLQQTGSLSDQGIALGASIAG